MPDDIIVYEEDIEEAFEKCITMFGKPGRIVYPTKNAILDAVIYTPKHGKLWYGDLYKNDLQKLVELQQEIGSSVEVLH